MVRLGENHEVPGEGHQPLHIAVIGAGNVGATIAFNLLNAGLAETLSLIDIDLARAEGETLDLQDGLPFMDPARVRFGDYRLCRQADLVIITAGVRQKPGQSRLDLLPSNALLFKEIIPAIVSVNREAVILVVTNPVDVLTYLAIKISGLPPGQVFGSGTVLDTARLRYQIGAHCQIDPRNVHGYVIGEHGESALPVWSTAQIAGMLLENFCHYCGRGCTLREEIGAAVHSAAGRVIQRKGATFYSIAMAVQRITRSIIRNENSVLTVSTLVEDYYGIRDLCFSLPAIVGRRGVKKILPLELKPAEIEALRAGAGRLQSARDEALRLIEKEFPPI